MTTDELIARFALERVSKNPAMFDEQKLRWMNGHYLRELPSEEVRARLEGLTGREIPLQAVAISQEKMQTLSEFWPLAKFLVEPQDFDQKAWDKVMGDGAPERLTAARRSARSARLVPARGRGGRPALGGRAPRGQAYGRFPARARRDQPAPPCRPGSRIGGGAGRDETLGASTGRFRGPQKPEPRRAPSSTFGGTVPIALGDGSR